MEQHKVSDSRTIENCTRAGVGDYQLPDTPEERVLFEAYMKGHSWAIGEYNIETKSYSDTLTRMLYGVWRDAAGLCLLKTR